MPVTDSSTVSFDDLYRVIDQSFEKERRQSSVKIWCSVLAAVVIIGLLVWLFSPPMRSQLMKKTRAGLLKKNKTSLQKKTRLARKNNTFRAPPSRKRKTKPVKLTQQQQALDIVLPGGGDLLGGLSYATANNSTRGLQSQALLRGSIYQQYRDLMPGNPYSQQAARVAQGAVIPTGAVPSTAFLDAAAGSNLNQYSWGTNIANPYC